MPFGLLLLNHLDLFVLVLIILFSDFLLLTLYYESHTTNDGVERMHPRTIIKSLVDVSALLSANITIRKPDNVTFRKTNNCKNISL